MILAKWLQGVSRILAFMTAMAIALGFATAAIAAVQPHGPHFNSQKKLRHPERIADPPSVSITSCGTISGSGYYIVMAALTSVSGDCLDITASDVTLNLNGYSLKGPGTGGSAAGISIASGISNTYIVGNGSLSNPPGSITDCAYGVLDNGTNSFIEDFEADNNAIGIYFFKASGSVAMDFDANNNSNAGVLAAKSADVSVVDFQANNDDRGVETNASDNFLATLFAASHDTLGVEVNSNNNTITAFQADSDNTAVTIGDLENEAEGVVQGGVATGSTVKGIVVNNGSIDFKISGNVVHGTGGYTSDLEDDNPSTSCVNQWFGNTATISTGTCTHEP
jgi:hypothetical protein